MKHEIEGNVEFNKFIGWRMGACSAVDVKRNLGFEMNGRLLFRFFFNNNNQFQIDQINF